MQLPQNQDVPHFDRSLRISGVDVLLRVFPLNGQFMFQTSRVISDKEKDVFIQYMKNEGFLDNPITGEPPQSASA